MQLSSERWWENNSPPSERIQEEVHQRHLEIIGEPGSVPLSKRLFDFTLALFGLIFSAPIWLVSAVLVWIEDPGPILFVKNSVGKGGINFRQFKFRTMVPGAEESTGPVLASEEDKRILLVGRILRKTALDELPQLINILRGEMSFVGPRPEMPWLVDKYESWQRKRFEVPQGLTGWWQINGRADKPMYLHTEDDLFYIRNYSLWLDFQIILRTVVGVITGRGAY